MPAEEMSKLTGRTRLIFAASSVVFLVVLAISPFKDFRREWKQYKRSYLRFAQGRADTKKLLADYHPDIDQIWLPEMNVVDRCTTCHQGMTQASLARNSSLTATAHCIPFWPLPGRLPRAAIAHPGTAAGRARGSPNLL